MSIALGGKSSFLGTFNRSYESRVGIRLTKHAERGERSEDAVGHVLVPIVLGRAPIVTALVDESIDLHTCGRFGYTQEKSLAEGVDEGFSSFHTGHLRPFDHDLDKGREDLIVLSGCEKSSNKKFPEQRKAWAVDPAHHSEKLITELERRRFKVK